MKEVIAKVIKKVLEKDKIKVSEEEILKFIEVPPSPEMGDYAFPCFFLAAKLKQAPHEIALHIREKIDESPFDDVQTAGGYVNFFVNRKELAVKIVKDILNKADNYGKINIGKGKKALLEHTSINPNASPHVGRARNAIIGDSLARILKFVGFKPEIHYYVNDVSKQIAMLVLALKDKEKLKFEHMLKEYIEISKKVKRSKKLESEVFDLLYNFEQGVPQVQKNFKNVTRVCVKGQESILSQLDIHYDVFDYESDYISKAQKILALFQKTGKLHKDKNKRLVLNQSGTSVEGKMKSPYLVLTRNDGTGLYPLRDIAYTIEKMRLSPQKNIVVLGEDQKLYFQQISEALKLLSINVPEIVHYSFILLKKKSGAKKMSTRKGEVVLLEDFIKDAVKKAEKEIAKRKTSGDPKVVGVAAVKYAILKTNMNKSMVFDLDEALNFEGDTGPYLLYSYARASSILRKAKATHPEKFTSPKQLEPKEFELIKKLSEFPPVVLNAYDNLSPSIIANYSYQLAQIFNEFYHACPVIGSESESFRLALVQAFCEVLRNSLSLLGISVLQEM
jgi:arginyl-tRNA synthetase